MVGFFKKSVSFSGRLPFFSDCLQYDYQIPAATLAYQQVCYAMRRKVTDAPTGSFGVLVWCFDPQSFIVLFITIICFVFQR